MCLLKKEDEVNKEKGERRKGVEGGGGRLRGNK